MIENLTGAQAETALNAAAALWASTGGEDPGGVLSQAERDALDRVAQLRSAGDGYPDDSEPAPETDAARAFVQAVAGDTMVSGDFGDAPAAFNTLIDAARTLAGQLGIGYQAGERSGQAGPSCQRTPA